MRLGAADTPEVVARATLAALGRSMSVVPGLVGKLLTYSLMTAPRALRVRIMAKIMGGMTSHLGRGESAAKHPARA
jgi:short-subunit dehydrogenase